jgi:hypothetical protein
MSNSVQTENQTGAREGPAPGLGTEAPTSDGAKPVSPVPAAQLPGILQLMLYAFIAGILYVLYQYLTGRG